MSQRVWLVDASIYIFRAWFSIPDRWYTADGMPLNAVYGYAGFLCDLLTRIQPAAYLAAAFDESLGTCFRNEIYPGYKASRALPDESLAFQLASCRELTQRCGIACLGGERYEADDYIASLASLCRQAGMPVTVITRDKDLGQLLSTDEDCWWDFAADQTLDTAGFTQRFGVAPGCFADYLGLAGDSVDDIPGVPGIGPKTAAALIARFEDLEGIERNMDAVASLGVRGAGALPDKLAAHWSTALLSRQLARLETNVPGVDTLPGFSHASIEIDAVVDYLRSLGLSGPIIKRWHRLGEVLQQV